MARRERERAFYEGQRERLRVMEEQRRKDIEKEEQWDKDHNWTRKLKHSLSRRLGVLRRETAAKDAEPDVLSMTK